MKKNSCLQYSAVLEIVEVVLLCLRENSWVTVSSVKSRVHISWISVPSYIYIVPVFVDTVFFCLCLLCFILYQGSVMVVHHVADCSVVVCSG